MLKELYDYAVRNDLAAEPGFKKKRLKAYVCISMAGEFLGIDPPSQSETYCPDMGSAAQGPTKCNVPVEKRLITLSEEKPLKREFFLTALKDAEKSVPHMGVLRETLENAERVREINEALDGAKIKMSDIIGYKVDGVPLESVAKEWWREFRKADEGEKDIKGLKRCLVTGELRVPLETVDKISGLRSVGGHSSGDALVCFDKDAFCSYGLKQAKNACIGADAMAAVNGALTCLIGKAPVLAGAKWIHWYKKPLDEGQEDIFGEIFGESAFDDGEETEDTEISENIADARADRLIESYRTGERVDLGEDNTYYIMAVSGAGGRVMIRAWQQGSYRELRENMNLWWSDLSLTEPYGKGMLRLPTLGRLNYRLLKPQKGGESVSDRMKKELSGIEPQLILSVINGGPLPDGAAAKALQYIRSQMLGGDEGSGREPVPDGAACQILKAWLMRKYRFEKRGGEEMECSCNSERKETAYQCGRMMAVYAAIQARAMGNVGAGVIQRYYTAALTSPAMVFGRLSSLSQHHLAKLENRGAVMYYENLLSEIASKIGRSIPVTLSLAQQAEFTLGYYQQRAAMYGKNNSENN